MPRRAFVVVLLGVLTAAFASAASAQTACKAFRAITQAQYPTTLALNTPLNIWGGDVFASLGAPGAKKMAEALIGAFSGQDADDYATDSRTRTFGGMGLNGSYTFAFGNPNTPGIYTDSFTLRLGRAVWNMGPGQNVGDYQASGEIASGSGRFLNATGNLTVHGAFFFTLVPNPDWDGTDPNTQFLEFGRWIPEVSGTICGAK